MNELAGQSLGGYMLEEEIGRGSMGMVYRGKQIALGREVAIKVLPRVQARFACLDTPSPWSRVQSLLPTYNRPGSGQPVRSFVLQRMDLGLNSIQSQGRERWPPFPTYSFNSSDGSRRGGTTHGSNVQYCLSTIKIKRIST